jgi:predicted metal-dependent HD superfamily phosphohydrolase
VVTLEHPPGDADASRERVELVQGGIAHEVAPALATPPPPRLVDQDGHTVRLAQLRVAHCLSMSDELEIGLAWHRSVGDGPEQSRVLTSLVARHREPHRRYHGVRHVCWVLRHVDELAAAEPVDDLAAIVVAACFHDAVYDPRAAANEAASARLARHELAAISWPQDRIDAVGTMIEATASHVGDAGATAHEGDVAVLLDADLAVLGAPPNAYGAYATGVRAEYAHVDDAAWRSGRAAILRSLLERPVIYRTPTGRSRWESRARANLTAELASLR